MKWKLLSLHASEIVALVYFLGMPFPSAAHAILVKSVPGEGATVPAVPRQVEVWFNEGVGENYMALAVIDSNGQRIDNKDAKFDPTDQSHLIVTLPEVPPGAYTVRYRVQSSDGHIITGKYNFSTQEGK